MNPLAAALAATIALAATTPAAAQPRVSVTATTPWANDGGYTPVVVRGHAPGASSLTLKASCSVISAEATVAPAADGTFVATVALPPVTRMGGTCYAPRVDWRADDGRSGSAHAQVIIALNGAGIALVDPAGSLPPVSRWRVHVDVKTVEPGDLPDRWQTYPQWLPLMLTPEAQARLSEAQRHAIATWTQSGGRLLVTTAAQTAEWEARAGAAVAIRLDGTEEVGFVDDRLPGVPTDVAAPTDVAFGRVVDEVLARRYWGPISWPVPGTEDIPVDGFLLLVIAFALVAGPLNLWWVIRRRRQRAAFLWTTPALSAATCVALIAFNLVSEGVTTRRVHNELTFIDVAHHRAFSWQAMSFFAPFGEPSWQLGLDDQVLPLDPDHRHDDWRWDVEPDPLQLAWRPDAQLATGAWVPARKTRQLVVAAPRPERQRLLVRPDGAAYRLTNGLDRTLVWVAWFDGRGQPWVARQVAPGAEVTLERSTRDLVLDDAEHPPDLFGAAARGQYYASQAPHHFRAQLDGPLAAAPGPDADDVTAPRAWAFGRLAPDAAGAP